MFVNMLHDMMSDHSVFEKGVKSVNCSLCFHTFVPGIPDTVTTCAREYNFERT